ncbi:protein IMPACT-like [Gigantopelta aegis]|uniref:protein IMPACT-like n=1 Tax=Gigantopelta aegis TaxID=1735272 RepID=UPI001B88965F|nr:protein IMPACT-like [Gigantopelta aegis]
MATEDNLTRQVEEIEALTAMYPEELVVIDEVNRTYCITLRSQHNARTISIPLQFQLPTDYPNEAPPQFQLLASWLRGPERNKIEDTLSEIYIVNQGESIIYLWIEAVREFLEDFPNMLTPNTENSRPPVKPKEPATEVVDEPEVEGISNLSLDYEHYQSKKDDSSRTCPELIHGEFLWDRKSKFQAHLAAVHHKDEVELVRSKLLEDRKVAAATHNIIAYRIKQTDSDVMYNGCEDDGEIHAGSRLLHLLEILEAVNVMVIVTRWYGGIHLGPDRFKHISNCARDILHQNGYIREKHEKKGPRSKTSKAR